MYLVIFFPIFLAILFPLLALGFSMMLGRQGHRWFMISSPVFFAILLLLLLLHIDVNEGWDSLAALGFTSAGLAGWFVMAALVGYGQYLAEKTIVMRMGGRPHPQVKPEMNLYHGGLFVVLVVISVIAEELIWRAYLIPAMSQAWEIDLVWAAFVAALLFGSHHAYFGWQHIAFKAVHGGIWTALFWTSGSLWSAVVAHTVFNFCIYFLAGRNLPTGNPPLGGGTIMR